VSAPSRTRAQPTTRPTRADLPLTNLPLACGLRLALRTSQASPRGEACTGAARLPSSPPTAMSRRPCPAASTGKWMRTSTLSLRLTLGLTLILTRQMDADLDSWKTSGGD